MATNVLFSTYTITNLANPLLLDIKVVPSSSLGKQCSYFVILYTLSNFLE